MEIKPQGISGRLIVHRYGNGGFVIGGQTMRGSVLVFPERALAWPVASLADVTTESLAEVTGGSVELLLLGCGPRGALVDAHIRSFLRASRVGIEAMDTGAACRTYNVLVAEGRRVAAALVAVG